MFRMILATIIGYVLGLERKRHDKSGGSRTMALISLGACLLAILSLELYNDYSFDFVRLMSYSLPAIGFLGVGIINEKKKGVDGLTTSATLITLLPIGFMIGLGFYYYSIASSILVYLILESKYWKYKENYKCQKK